MEKKMKRRSYVRVVSFVAALAAVLVTASICGNVRASKYERQITLSQQRALTELDGRLREIGTSLKKGVYSSTPPMLSGMASELSRETLAAKSSLSVLPLENTNLENTYKFLSQVGDFTETLNRKVASGESISDEERENLRSLITFCDALSGEVSNIRADMFDGSFSFSQKSGELALTGEKTEYLAGDMEDAQQSLSDYPTLIYDGPFSDHIMSAQPKMTSGAKEISKENALDAAAAFLGCDKKEISFLSEESGNVPAYCFSHNNKTVAVTKNGGYVIYMLDSSFAGEAKLKTADALKKASEFLSSHGYADMKESYYSTSDGVCTVNYAYKKDGVIYYPDLIKVGVNLETGDIASFDAKGYIMNHTERNLSSDILSRADAQKSVSGLLTVLDSKRAVIPTKSKGEKDCWEFHCTDKDGNEVLVYIDTKTGYEDDILLLLYSDGGILTK